MPLLEDRNEIRRKLRKDPIWSIYALGDLQEPWFSSCRWYGPELALVFRGYDTGVLFAMGPDGVREAVAAEGPPLSLQLKPDAFAAAVGLGHVRDARKMWRMYWDGKRSGWVDTGEARRLGPEHAGLLADLYADGSAAGESPDFFYASMIEAGPFYGIVKDGRLAAAAGTHIAVPEEGIAAIGNVYTRRDYRGQGLARLVTCAVLRDLRGIKWVGLNVRQDNAAAIRVYETLGFRRHCAFFEGLLS